jgi:hypothetical protein
MLTAADPAPPLGFGALADGSYRPETFRYAPGDVLLLYTDGISEARNALRTFYPLTRRAAAWAWCGPGQLIANIEADLRAYVPGGLTDDMAMVAVRREPAGSAGQRPHRGRSGRLLLDITDNEAEMHKYTTDSY